MGFKMAVGSKWKQGLGKSRKLTDKLECKKRVKMCIHIQAFYLKREHWVWVGIHTGWDASLSQGHAHTCSFKLLQLLLACFLEMGRNRKAQEETHVDISQQVHKFKSFPLFGN